MRNMKYLTKMESALGLNDSIVILGSNKAKSTESEENDREKSDGDSISQMQPCQIMSLEKEEEELEAENPKKNEILKKTVLTILLTHHWQKTNLQKLNKDGRKQAIKYEPTYRLDPLVNVNDQQSLIRSKLHSVFESINNNHANYDTDYSPRFLRIISEMLKNECKAFNLDRYKIIVQVSLLEKRSGQSIEIISKLLASNNTDLRICFNYEGKTFYTICLIFFIYYE